MSSADNKEKTIATSGPQWGNFYVLAEHWQSDLEFYKDDLRFLHLLVDKYFIWITKSENIDLVKEIMIQVQQLEKDCHKLIDDVVKHKSNLSKIAEEYNADSMERSTIDHEKLENELYSFVKEFRANRKEVFRITEYVIDSEELSSLMKQ